MCGVDPSAELLAKARDRVANVGFPVRLLEASSEKLPLENRSFDTIVMTFTLCSIPDPDAALLEIRRVLKPEGELLFAEHGRAPDSDVMHWQDRITPIWKRIGGGCHLNRKVKISFKPPDFVSSRPQLRIPEIRSSAFLFLLRRHRSAGLSTRSYLFASPRRG